MAKNATQFVQDMFTDAELAGKVDAVRSAEGIVQLGKEYGASFTADEFKQALESASHSMASDLRAMGVDISELSVDDLDMVAGGGGRYYFTGSGSSEADNSAAGKESLYHNLHLSVNWRNKIFTNIE